ncbi:hypothetical protein BX589_101139 [Paraburkholderia fungorum]|jgi:hypothetical protein|uniref:hypothetical protein n=1 Tax=Paraburkholderia fungorum TaxID=134537 RepID=UPI000D07A3F8|nr:hypothetical protein [Paraburkholderia fungorum]PRZ56489.1 hypothetical protein BX589_101139 [Paraburkholderia fungorum]
MNRSSLLIAFAVISLASLVSISVASHPHARPENVAALRAPKCIPSESPWTLDMTSKFPDGHEKHATVFTCFPIGARADDAFVEDAVQSVNDYWVGYAASLSLNDGAHPLRAIPFKDGAIARKVENPQPWRDPSRSAMTGLLDELFARI